MPMLDPRTPLSPLSQHPHAASCQCALLTMLNMAPHLPPPPHCLCTHALHYLHFPCTFPSAYNLIFSIQPDTDLSPHALSCCASCCITKPSSYNCFATAPTISTSPRLLHFLSPLPLTFHITAATQMSTPEAPAGERDFINECNYIHVPSLV